MIMEFNKSEESGVFFTSDTHFNHKNIIKYCKRPFKDVNEMNETLIENWNKVVSDADTVFHLGDFAFGGFPVWEEIRPRLNGSIYLILGNHDFRQNVQNLKKLQGLFTEVTSQKVIKINRQKIILNHYPLLCFAGSYDNSVWQLFGHCHSGPNSNGKDDSRLSMLYPTQYDVGVDNNNYYPISYSEVKEKINKQIENYKLINGF